MKRRRIKIKLTIKPKPQDGHSSADRSLQRQLSTLGNDVQRELASLGNCYDRQIAQLAPKRRAKRRRTVK